MLQLPPHLQGAGEVFGVQGGGSWGCLGSPGSRPLSCRVPLPRCHPTCAPRASAGSAGTGAGGPLPACSAPEAVSIQCLSLAELRWSRTSRTRSPARAEGVGDSRGHIPIPHCGTAGAGGTPQGYPRGWWGLLMPRQLLLYPISVPARGRESLHPHLLGAGVQVPASPHLPAPAACQPGRPQVCFIRYLYK